MTVTKAVTKADITKAEFRVVITRPEAQAEALKSALSEARIAFVHCPLLKIEAVDSQWPADHFDGAIFTSPNAVDYCLNAEYNPALTGADCNRRIDRFGQIFAIGDKTKSKLQDYCEQPIHAPEIMNSEGLLAMNALSGLFANDEKKPSLLIIKGQGGRSLLADTLRQRGAMVSYFDCYRRQPLAPNLRIIGSDDIWLISSSEAMRCLASHIEKPKLLVSSDRLAKEAAAMALPVVTISEGASDRQWLQAVQSLAADTAG